MKERSRCVWDWVASAITTHALAPAGVATAAGVVGVIGAAQALRQAGAAARQVTRAPAI